MERISEHLGCRCKFSFGNFGGESKRSDTPAHTFPWAQTQYRPDRPVTPLKQSFDLELDFDKCTLSGSVEYEIQAVQAQVDSFEIESVDLKIHGITFDSQKVEYEVDTEQVKIKLNQKINRGTKGKLKINYTCTKPKAGLYFIKPDEHYKNRPNQVWTQGQDDDSRYWFPCFDDPSVKSAFEMKIKVPSGFIATSNGALVSENRSGSHWNFHWKTDTNIPSYLVTLTAGQFAEIKEDWRGKTVNFLFEKGREKEAQLSFGKTRKMMDLFSEVTGVEYPYEKYSQIAASQFIFGGMENTSATTQTDLTLHPPEIEEDYSSDDLVAHELAHQWFGDLVTCKSWSHGWLNEGWATFMEQVFKEKDMGEDETHYFRLEEFHIYEGEDSGVYRRPIVSNFYTDPADIWDRHLYQKGGLVLNHLRSQVGHEDFWASAKLYLNKYRGMNTETVDFQRAFEEVTGKNLQKFFDQWVYKGGYPELEAGFSWDDKKKVANFKLKQTQKVDSLTPLFSFESSVDFVMADGTIQNLPFEVSEAEHTFSMALKEKPSYVRFDVGNHVPKALDWKIPLEMIKNQLSKDTDVVGKVWAMKAISKEANREGIAAIIDRLKNDSFWGVRAEAAQFLGEARSAEALDALVSCLATEKKSKVRTKICDSLGKYKDGKIVDPLRKVLKSDPSVWTKGAAAASLGHSKNPEVFNDLVSALEFKTWNDVLAGKVYLGLKNLRDDRAIPVLMKGASYGAPAHARASAISALAEFGFERRDITEFLVSCLDDPFFRAKSAALEALVKRKNPGVIGYIESSAHRTVDGHYKASAFRAIRKLRKSLDRPSELEEFKESLEKLSEENRKLRDRIEKLEKV